MAYVLGAAYVKYYPSLLLPYSQTTVHVESTDYERTINTAAGFMQGVYSGQPVGTAYSASLSAPLYTQTTVTDVISTLSKTTTKYSTSAAVPPIHTDESIILAAGRNCPMYETWVDQNGVNSTIKNTYTTYMKDVVAYLKTKKINVRSMDDLFGFADIAISNAYAEIPIPGGIDPASQYYQDLKFAYEWTSAVWYTAQTIQTELTSIDTFQNVLNLMDKVIAGKSAIKFSMFSAHDVTLLPLLATLGIVNDSCLLANYVAKKAGKTLPYPNCVFPGFTANLAFELYGGKSPYVVVYYNGNLIKVCNGQSSCGLTAFRTDIQTRTNHLYNNANFKTLCA